MNRILIAGQSSTLCRGIEKRFESVAHAVDSCNTYIDALNIIKNDGGTGLRVVVIGHNGEDADGWNDLKSLLDAPLFHKVAVLVVATEKSRDVFEWTARRAHSGMLILDEVDDILEQIRHLTRDLETELLLESEDGLDTVRILFVDDSKTSRVRFSKLLEKNGYVVETATCYQEGLKKAADGNFDIAIIDYFMPDGNGDELCKAILQNPATNHIHPAILTGSYLDELIHDSLASGAVECMFKNEPEALFLARIAAISRAVQSRKSVDAEHQRLLGILNSVGDGVYGVDTRGIITFANPAAIRILGYRNDVDLVGKRAHDLVHFAHRDGSANPEETCFLQQAYEAGEELDFWETVFWNSSRQPVDVECGVQPLRINGVLKGSVVGFRDIVERKMLEKELLWQANHDALTELFNRHHFEEELESEVLLRKRSNEHSAVLYIDLDRFKNINDAAGHAAGDRLLVEISSQLKSRLRTTDILARLGGDEFAVILRHINKDGIAEVADSFREVLEEYSFNYEGKQYPVHGSVGVCVIDRSSLSASEVMSSADIACHIAKTDGRNRVHVFNPETDKSHATAQEVGWSQRLQQALELDQFVLHYQPVIHTETDNAASPVMYYEVLLRYVDENNELVQPNAFLSAAERFGIVPDIDRWMIRHAITKLASVRNQVADWVFGINLSAVTINSPGLTEFIKDTLKVHNVEPSSLIIEISESAAVENIDATRKIMDVLGKAGCRFVLDDYGSGFSSFNCLKNMPVDLVKISGHYIRDVDKDKTDLAIVKSINDVAHAFGKKTVAVQVESLSVAKIVRDIGIDHVQGWHICEPAPEPVKCDKLKFVEAV